MTKNLKKIGTSILMLFALAAAPLMAQPGGGGGGMGGGMGGPGGGMGERPEGMGESSSAPDLLAQAGYFELDGEEIIKKIKVKDNDMKTAVRKVVIAYTEGYENTTVKCAKEIATVQAAQKKVAESQGDRNAMRTLMQGTSESTTAIRTEMVALHKKLSEVDMPEILDEKTLEKWTKYYSALCQSKGFRLNQQQRRGRGEGQEGEGGERPQRPQQE